MTREVSCVRDLCEKGASFMMFCVLRELLRDVTYMFVHLYIYVDKVETVVSMHVADKIWRGMLRDEN